MEQIPLRSEWAKTHQSSGEMKKNQTNKSVDGKENDERKPAFWLHIYRVEREKWSESYLYTFGAVYSGEQETEVIE